jgi:hypothetical protein
MVDLAAVPSPTPAKTIADLAHNLAQAMLATKRCERAERMVRDALAAAEHALEEARSAEAIAQRDLDAALERELGPDPTVPLPPADIPF